MSIVSTFSFYLQHNISTMALQFLYISWCGLAYILSHVAHRLTYVTRGYSNNHVYTYLGFISGGAFAPPPLPP